MIGVLLMSFYCMRCIAQEQTSTAGQPVSLEKLNGYSQTFFYSAGQQERAKSIAEFMEGAGRYFQQELAFTPKTILYILSPGDWKYIAAKPLIDVYGFPHNIDQVHLAVAAEDNDFWRSFLPPVDQLSPPVARQVKKAYGKQDGSYSMMPFFDLLALHEVGHSYTSQAGLKMHRFWMGELFVNVMLHTWVAEMQPDLLPALETLPAIVVAGGQGNYKYTSLADFENLYATMGMGPKNYGWYQCRLHSAAKDIYDAGGRAVMKKLWTALYNHQEEMTDKEFVTMLKEEVHPAVANVYSNWDKID